MPRSPSVRRGERARVAQRVLDLLDPARAGGAHHLDEGRPSTLRRVRAALGAAVSRRGWRVNPGSRGAAAMGISALVAALVAGWWVLSARPHAAAIEPSALAHVSSGAAQAASGSESPSRSPAGSAATSHTVELLVDVVGHVRSPGLYHLSAGARVDDAIRAAGGALPGIDLTGLNLARKVSDGEQIAVGVAGAAPAVTGASGSGATAGPVDLNTATLAELDALPGVGPVLAQHILDWRTAHDRFSTVDQLREVNGIGSAKFADLRPLVTV